MRETSVPMVIHSMVVHMGCERRKKNNYKSDHASIGNSLSTLVTGALKCPFLCNLSKSKFSVQLYMFCYVNY